MFFSPGGLISSASNIVTGTNPAFTKDDFLGVYPQFAGHVPEFLLDEFVTMADSVVKEARWGTQWKHGMRLFIAHFATLYLRTLPGDNASADEVITAAQTKGLISSESAGDVSVSYDYSTLSSEINGWAGWKQTEFGTQYAALAKNLGIGGVYVW